MFNLQPFLGDIKVSPEEVTWHLVDALAKDMEHPDESTQTKRGRKEHAKRKLSKLKTE